MKSLNQLKEEIKALKSKGYRLKTTRARRKAFEAARELEREALNILYTAAENVGPQSMRATVKHTNHGDEHFLVDTPYGSMWLSPTADVLSKSWYNHTCCIEYTKGQTITFEFRTEVNHDGLFLEIVLGKVTGGRINEEQYATLCKRDDLAFFKYPNSNGVTGLFASYKGA